MLSLSSTLSKKEQKHHMKHWINDPKFKCVLYAKWKKLWKRKCFCNIFVTLFRCDTLCCHVQSPLLSCGRMQSLFQSKTTKDQYCDCVVCEINTIAKRFFIQFESQECLEILLPVLSFSPEVTFGEGMV